MGTKNLVCPINNTNDEFSLDEWTCQQLSVASKTASKPKVSFQLVHVVGLSQSLFLYSRTKNEGSGDENIFAFVLNCQIYLKPHEREVEQEMAGNGLLEMANTRVKTTKKGYFDTRVSRLWVWHHWANWVAEGCNSNSAINISLR